MEGKAREGGKEMKKSRKKGIVVTTLSQTGKSASNISRSHRPHTSLISRGHRPHTTLIHKMPSKGYEAMQVRVRTNTVESLKFINNHAK